MKYTTVDVETTIRNTGEGAVGDFSGAVYHPDNTIVVIGWKHKGCDFECSYRPFNPHWFLATELLVGHNIRFDLQYLRKLYGEHFNSWMYTGRIWDTQLAEYLLSGQSHLYPTLNDCAAKYGGTQKIDVIKELWDAGVQTEDMEEELLTEYLRGDVENTELIFEAQVKEAHRRGMLPLMWSQMDALLATCEMEYNGMHFDKEEALRQAAELEGERDGIITELEKVFKAAMPKLDKVNVSSAQQLSKVLFGGEYKYKVDEEVLDASGVPVLFKSGKRKGEVKTKRSERCVGVVGLGYTPREKWAAKAVGVYKVGDDILQNLLAKGGDHPVIDSVLRLRQLNKDIDTYFLGYANLTWHDGCIHGSLNHCSTGTGRLSSTQPNIQNISNKER